jgi:hypothetical protein
MKNLAGFVDPDPYILHELERCGIKPLPLPQRVDQEVRYGWIGHLGPIEFTRAWYYWRAHGPVPLDVAKRLYELPIGKTDIRVAGHCACPAPEPPWLKFRDANGRKIVHDPHGKEERDWDSYTGRVREILDATERPIFARDAFAVADRVFVDCYHIDSELGLYLFAEELKRSS